MPQRRRDRQAGAVAAGGRHREAARGQNHARCSDHTGRGVEPPSIALAPEPGDSGSKLKPHAAAAGERDQAIPHVACAVRAGKELPGLGLQRQRNSDLFLEEPPLGGEGPRAQDAAQQGCRRVGDEALGRQHRRQDVASAAATDQDLPAAVGGALDHHHRSGPLGREDGSHEASRAGAHDDGWIYLKNSSSGATRKVPSFSAAMPGSITFRSPMTTTAILSGWM
jgi:hypothetical protein